MQANAVHKYAHISPQKVRLVVDLVRGKHVAEALQILKFTNKKAAGLVSKVIQSAIANAEHNAGADIDALRVAAISVDEGPVMKRLHARAKGRANRIVKRTSHINVTVAEK